MIQLGALTGNDFLQIRLGLMEELLPAIDLVAQGRNQITSLQRHVKLEVSDVLAEIFSIDQVFLNRSVRGVIEARIQSVLSQLCIVNRRNEPIMQLQVFA